jgi:hypothetical protein
MGRNRDGDGRRDESVERIDTVRVEDMEDSDRDVRGTTTERYTVAPPVNVVHEETTRRALPQEEPTLRQQPMRRWHASCIIRC